MFEYLCVIPNLLILSTHPISKLKSKKQKEKESAEQGEGQENPCCNSWTFLPTIIRVWIIPWQFVLSY